MAWRKKHLSYTIKDLHGDFKKRKKQEKVPFDKIMPYKVYKKLIEAFFAAVFKKIIYENFTFTMPHSLGSIVVKSFKVDPWKTTIDFHNTIKYKKPIRFLNRHTFGYAFRIWWNKEYVKFRNNSYYIFRPIAGQYATKQGIGKIALGRHIKKLSEDPEKRNYIRI